MANEEHLAILKQGWQAWNEWREKNDNISPDLSRASLAEAKLGIADLVGTDVYGTARSLANLSGANLSGARLSLADLSRADLSMANLSRARLRRSILERAILNSADLRSADLRSADLRFADLSGAILSYANLHFANLSGVNLSGANLSGTILSGALLNRATLSNADLSNASMEGAIFGEVDLSTVKGLETVRHQGRSTIGIDTIYKSQGKIPEVFLRGAGVPDSFITYMRSLTGEAIQYYTCFISYSTKDQAFATRLHADLQAKGVRCWFAPEDIAGGKKIHEQIDQAIRHYDKLLIVLSENSMASEWVKTEVYHARQQEAEENRRKLFPISLVPYESVRQWKAFDADTGKDMAREVREYFIPDFANWKEHDAYQKAFDRLLRDLKAEAS